MRVLFINPHYPMAVNSILLHPPLAYGYMAAELKRRGHEVEVLDLPMRANDITCERAFLEGYAPDLIGITCVTQSYLQMLEVAAFCKKVLPASPVVVGGPHVTFTPEETLSRHGDIDYVLMYDADSTCADLADALDAGPDAAQLKKVAGLGFRDPNSGEIVITPAAMAIDQLDKIAAPDRSIFDMGAYLKNDYETVVMTARGCPSSCSFCSTSQMGRHYRYHGVERAVDEIESVLDMGFSSIFIGDDTFAVRPDRTLAFCDEIKRRGLRFDWTSNMRVADARPQVLEAMREAGAYRVFMGIETIKAQSLKNVQKGSTPNTIRKAVSRVYDAGLEIHTAYIVGVPGDTPDDLRNTLEFIKEIKPSIATFNTMEVRPGTAVYNDPESFGVKVPDPLWYEKLDWMHTPACYTNDLSSADIKLWVERCYEEFCTAAFTSKA